jgi:hypothetical protein
MTPEELLRQAELSDRVNALAGRLYEAARPTSPTLEAVLESMTALCCAYVSACESQGVTVDEAAEGVRCVFDAQRADRTRAKHGGTGAAPMRVERAEQGGQGPKPSPEQNRDRILGAIDAVILDAYLAPEVKRSQLFAIVIAEFNAFAEYHGNIVARLIALLGVPQPGTSGDALVAEVARRLGVSASVPERFAQPSPSVHCEGARIRYTAHFAPPDARGAEATCSGCGARCTFDRDAEAWGPWIVRARKDGQP